jgi:hypothetical protein
MKITVIAATALLAAAAIAAPASAQEVITNPGKCAQYYPNANCQNLGPGNPYTGSGYSGEYGSYDRMGPMHWRRHHHHRHMR